MAQSAMLVVLIRGRRADEDPDPEQQLERRELRGSSSESTVENEEEIHVVVVEDVVAASTTDQKEGEEKAAAAAAAATDLLEEKGEMIPVVVASTTDQKEGEEKSEGEEKRDQKEGEEKSEGEEKRDQKEGEEKSEGEEKRDQKEGEEKSDVGAEDVIADLQGGIPIVEVAIEAAAAIAEEKGKVVEIFTFHGVQEAMEGIQNPRDVSFFVVEKFFSRTMLELTRENNQLWGIPIVIYPDHAIDSQKPEPWRAPWFIYHNGHKVIRESTGDLIDALFNKNLLNRFSSLRTEVEQPPDETSEAGGEDEQVESVGDS